MNRLPEPRFHQVFTTTSSTIDINEPKPCPGDTGDGVVGGADVAILLAVWGTDGDGIDGIVDGTDLTFLLVAWDVCP